MRARFIVRGLVQGVNFRNATVDEGTRLRLTGRVRNREDGTVEVLAEGDRGAIAQLERWLWKGPRLADVEAVERTDLPGDARYREFGLAYGPVG